MKKQNYIVYAVVVALLLKAYVGSTVRPDKRWLKEHLPALRRNKHYCRELQDAFNKYGEDSFYFVCVEVVDDLALLPKREQFWIAELKKVNAALNSNVSGSAGPRGKKFSQETRRKQSLAKRGDKHPDNRKDFVFTSPDDLTVKTHGLKDFCKEHHLSISGMSRVANHKQKVHRGWRAV